MPKRRRGPSKKRRQRERRAAERHGMAVEDYRNRGQDRDSLGYVRFQQWRERQHDGREGRP